MLFLHERPYFRTIYFDTYYYRDAIKHPRHAYLFVVRDFAGLLEFVGLFYVLYEVPNNYGTFLSILTVSFS